MGGTAKRVGAGLLTGGASELDRAGIGFTAGLTGKPGSSSKGGKNGGPTPPDFAAAAQEQARTSRNDVNGAFGGATWQQTPDGRWQMSTSMSPELQAAASNAMGQIGSQGPLTPRSMGPAPEARLTDVGTFTPGGNLLDPTATRDSALDAAYRMQTSRLDPAWSQRSSALETQLANEGASRGDAAWTQAMGDLGRDRNDAYQQALLAAQSGAGNTAFGQALGANQQRFGQDLSTFSTNADNALRQNQQNFGQELGSYQAGLAGNEQDWTQQLAAAMAPYQQLSNIQGLGEGYGRAALAGAMPLQSLDAANAAYQGALQNYGINQQGKNSMMGGLGQLGTLALLRGGGR